MIHRVIVILYETDKKNNTNVALKTEYISRNTFVHNSVYILILVKGICYARA